MGSRGSSSSSAGSMMSPDATIRGSLRLDRPERCRVVPGGLSHFSDRLLWTIDWWRRNNIMEENNLPHMSRSHSSSLGPCRSICRSSCRASTKRLPQSSISQIKGRGRGPPEGDDMLLSGGRRCRGGEPSSGVPSTCSTGGVVGVESRVETYDSERSRIILRIFFVFSSLTLRSAVVLLLSFWILILFSPGW
ncbi:hypothetical protein F5H01DRAFT_350577 [Linnemannia elongata]|nr:hypothetical protein F5H01DRAFT_350577 [Linnemannia elongata]